MFKSLHTYLPGSLDQFLFGRLRGSGRPPLPPRPSARRPQLLISRINTIPTEILLEIFLFVVSFSLSDHEPCFECSRRRHSGSQMLLTHPPAMILSHVCKRWREITLEHPPLWSFISNQDFCCEEWMKILLSRLWQVSSQSGPFLHPKKDNESGNGNDTPLLTIRFKICSRQSQNQIDRQLFLFRFLMQRSSARIRALSADITDNKALKQMYESWTDEGALTEIEELNISNGVPCGGGDAIESNYEKCAAYIKKGEEKEDQYISYLTFHHTPPLLFLPQVSPMPVSIFKYRYNDDEDDKTKKPESELRSRVPHLRKLSLTNCYLPVLHFSHFNNVEELTIIHTYAIRRRVIASYWKNVVHSLPRLRRLSIDGALAPCAKEFDPRDLPLSIEGHPSFEKRSTNLEELAINRCSPFWAAIMLRFFTTSSSILEDQRHQKKLLRKLQITCTDVEYDEDFRELCEAVRAWFNSWNSWTYEDRGGYLYLSIGPSGIIVHNRRVNIMETEGGEVNREAKNATDEEEPEIQLTLYSHSTLEWDLISDVLHLISSPPIGFDATAGPLALSCEELELSIGLFDIADCRFARVLTGFLETFGKAKKLKKLRCVGSMTARVLLSREFEGLTLLPILKTAYFDHVDFSNLDRTIRVTSNGSNPPSHVELIKCCNVRKEWVSKLQHVGTDVLVGRGTSIVEGSEGSKKVEKERWTSEQVKVTFYNLRFELFGLTIT